MSPGKARMKALLCWNIAFCFILFSVSSFSSCMSLSANLSLLYIHCNLTFLSYHPFFLCLSMSFSHILVAVWPFFSIIELEASQNFFLSACLSNSAYIFIFLMYPLHSHLSFPSLKCKHHKHFSSFLDLST